MEQAKKLSDGILNMDATELLEKYYAGEIKPGEAVDVYIDHQERVNRRFNLVVENRYTLARQEGDRCDARLREGNL